MRRRDWLLACLGAAVAASACSPTYVVVPGDAEHTRTQRVVVYDTVMVHDTIAVRERAQPRPAVARVDTVVRVDTVFRSRATPRVDTVIRVDTLTIARVDTVRLAGPATRVDTVRVVDTVVRVDTVRVTDAGPKPRRLTVPPGHHPPAGQCRVWVDGVPPGRQVAPAPCDALGTIPAAAFILYGGMAWDGEFDWAALEMAEPGSAPPEIVAAVKPGSAAQPGPGAPTPRRPDRGGGGGSGGGGT
jgi:hypothetical protein